LYLVIGDNREGSHPNLIILVMMRLLRGGMG